MTRDDILRLAREAGDKSRVDPLTPDGEWVILTPDELERFAALVAEQERERCARLVETQDTNGDHVGGWFDLLAAKIRA